MSARIDPDGAAAANVALVTVGESAPLAPLAVDSDDRFEGPALPHDHPAWMRDAVALSQRARALIVSLRPVVLRVVGAWEHRMRSAVIGGRNVTIDASGSYRIP